MRDRDGLCQKTSLFSSVLGVTKPSLIHRARPVPKPDIPDVLDLTYQLAFKPINKDSPAGTEKLNAICGSNAATTDAVVRDSMTTTHQNAPPLRLSAIDTNTTQIPSGGGELNEAYNGSLPTYALEAERTIANRDQLNLTLQPFMGMQQRPPRPPMVPPPFSAPAAGRTPPRPPVHDTASMGAASTGGLMMRPSGSFGDRLALRATPVAVAAEAATARDGIETVTVTNVVSAPAINKIGSLFSSLNKTVTGALSNIIAGGPVAPGGSQTQPMSTALSPLPAWRAPPQRLPYPHAAVQLDHVQRQFQRPQVPPQQPIPAALTTVMYDPQHHHYQPQQQHGIVPSNAYWPSVGLPYQQPTISNNLSAPAADPACTWYSHSTTLVGPGIPYTAPAAVRTAPGLSAGPVLPPSTIGSVGAFGPPQPPLHQRAPAPPSAAFNHVDVTPSPLPPAAFIARRRGDWDSLPDIDQQRPGAGGGPPPGPPSPVFSHASSTYFIPPVDAAAANRFGHTLPLSHYPGRHRSHRRSRRAPSMPRASTSPTAGTSPVQSSTPSVEGFPPAQPPCSTINGPSPTTAAQTAPLTAPSAPARKPPTALNLSSTKRGRRKKSVISMPRVLPSPTVLSLHRIPGSINFPRVAGSPTPPSMSSTSASDDDGRCSPPLSASRRSFPADWDSTARHRLLAGRRRDSDDLVGGTLRRRTFDDSATPADVWRWDSFGGPAGKRQLPYADSLPRDAAAARSLLSMSTARSGPLSRQRSRPNSDTDDDEVWC